MLTQPQATKRSWRQSITVRILLILFGVILGTVGYVAFALETEYGGDVDRVEYVIAHEAGGSVQALTTDESGHEVVAFEGTQAEVDAFLERERGSRNYTVPILLLAGGAVTALLGVVPPRTAPGTPA
jgi:hypothetical protein